MMVRLSSIAGAALVALAFASPLQAQVQRSGGGGELQKFMQQYQQVAAEKSALQGQIAQLKSELDADKSELAGVKKERDSLKARAAAAASNASANAQLTASKEAAEKSLEASKQRMTELVDRFRDMAGSLKGVEADRAKLRKELDGRNTAFDTCVENNVKLYDITRETLDRYQHVGLFTKVSSEEPFTRITRTRIENLVDEYRQRAEELRSKKASP